MAVVFNFFVVIWNLKLSEILFLVSNGVSLLLNLTKYFYAKQQWFNQSVDPVHVSRAENHNFSAAISFHFLQM